MLSKLKGYRTYIVMAVIITLGGIETYNEYCGEHGCELLVIPSYIYMILGALGIYTRKVAGVK